MSWWQGARLAGLLMVGGAALAPACSSNEDGEADSSNGGSANGGSANGGSANGGSSVGGSANGGSSNGGSANGGSSNGGGIGGGGEAGDGSSGGGASGSSAGDSSMGGISGAGGAVSGGAAGAVGGGAAAGATTGGAGAAGVAGNGGNSGGAGAGSGGANAGAGGAIGGAGGAGGGNVGGSGGVVGDDLPNGSPCAHGGLCLSGHCRSGQCSDPPSWGSVTVLSSTPGAPAIAMPAFGNAAVVWRDDPTDRVLARLATGKVFAAEGRIDTEGGAVSVADPKVAFTGGQSFLAVWSESYGTLDYRVFGRPYSGSWGNSIDIDGTDISMQLPRIATDPSGNGAVVWDSRQPANVWMRQVTGTTLGTPANFGYGREQSIGVSPSGRIAVAWCVVVTGSADLMVATYTPGQGWGSPMQAYAGVSGASCNGPVIAVADSGDMAVTWSDGPSVGRPYARAYSPAGGWETSTLIEPDIRNGSLSPLPVFSPSGALLLVWYRTDSTINTCDVRYRLRLGGVWTPNQTLDECEDGSGFLTAASYDRESFRVIYHRGNPNVSGRELWEARYVGGQGFRDRRSISPVANQQLSPALALDRDGRGLLAWIHRVGREVNDPRDLRAMWLE